jgi:hypothetical protein
MKKLFILIAIAAMAASTFTGCKEKGCTNPNADNYNQEATEDDGCCTYPTINISSTNTSGDISGLGGTASKTVSFTNNNSTVGWDMAIDASSGSFQLVVKDADGETVIDETLTADSGAQDADGTSSSGTSGTWTATVSLTSFNGTGDYSLQ